MNGHEMSWSRQTALRLMAAKGWSHERNGTKHIFKRPDTGGLWDVVSVSHNNLSLDWAISHCDDLELAERIHAVRQAWVREAVPEAFTVKEEQR
jgi:hypothetical protein